MPSAVCLNKKLCLMSQLCLMPQREAMPCASMRIYALCLMPYAQGEAMRYVTTSTRINALCLMSQREAMSYALCLNEKLCLMPERDALCDRLNGCLSWIS